MTMATQLGPEMSINLQNNPQFWITSPQVIPSTQFYAPSSAPTQPTIKTQLLTFLIQLADSDNLTLIVATLALSAVYLGGLFTFYKLGKHYGLRFKKYSKEIKRHSNALKRINKKRALAKMLNRRLRSMIKWSLYMILVFYVNEIWLTYSSSEQVFHPEMLLKGLSAVSYAAAFCLFIDLIIFSMTWILSAWHRSLTKEKTVIEQKCSSYIEKMLYDLGGELTRALEQIFVGDVRRHISAKETQIAERIVEIQTMSSEKRVKEEEIISYQNFVTTLKDGFDWCENCIGACVDVKGDDYHKLDMKEQIKTAGFCYSNCKRNYMKFHSQARTRLIEELMKVQVMKKKLMEDARKVVVEDEAENDDEGAASQFGAEARDRGVDGNK